MIERHQEIREISAPTLNFEDVVCQYYRTLYQFAYGLTRSEADACDLTQQTFYVWATKGHQLKDASKIKTWLFTTLHRAFLESCRKQARFPHFELSQVDVELPRIAPASINDLDAPAVLQALAQVDEIYQVPVMLFYIEDEPYKEIARVLAIPIGTVKSRISRGISQLQAIMNNAMSSHGLTRTGTVAGCAV
jgi:RNA polymerase sigma-70 factor (ECF subfamily)